ncbi:ribosomal protein S18 acetylase RimI-like enzyme [Paenibacillus eucommiae]|uniref:Ribosomal protein S18 acetylase RimI-like enzyme n=1 Tax=Paenibacillus eucommiae TaxID=1355755 RepID=A0ABS4IQ20_9BACL|nr:ribosomal protein S18 acetylase RimI-like enzyme [Paenibacillus eucommiae]
MDARIRLASPSDANELSRLNQEFNGGDQRPAADIIESLNDSAELIAIAEIGGKVVGFGCAQSFRSFCYSGLQGEITELYVAEAARRKGIATSLIFYLEECLKKRGVKSVKVLTGRRNHAAIKTYEQCDYHKDDELLLKKKL